MGDRLGTPGAVGNLFFSPSDFSFLFLCGLTFFFTVCVLTFRFLNPLSPSSSSFLSFFLIMLIFQLSSFSFCKRPLFFFLMLVTSVSFFFSWPVFSCPPTPPHPFFSSFFFFFSRFSAPFLFQSLIQLFIQLFSHYLASSFWHFFFPLKFILLPFICFVSLSQFGG